jgi:hypothetical protein
MFPFRSQEINSSNDKIQKQSGPPFQTYVYVTTTGLEEASSLWNVIIIIT